MFNTEQSAYEALRNIVAERTNGLIWWIGSGLSRPAGLPTWAELKAALFKAFQDKVRTFDVADQETAKKLLLAIQLQQNMWIAFKMLREELGEATYSSIIRNKLSAADTANIPPVYETLWKFKPSGIISLNLDSLAARSHTKVMPTSVLNATVGLHIHQSLHFLKSPKPFVAYMHGTADAKDSWIFTYDDIKTLMSKPGYKEFIIACHATRSIVFVGISADDQAAGGHLAMLAEKRIDSGQHFWITDRKDRSTDQWAEAAGIQVIRYATPKGSHAELEELFEDLISYVPKEQEVQPVFRTTEKISTQKRLPATKIIQLTHEEAQKHLNAYAGSIFLKGTGESVYAEYAAFCRDTKPLSITLGL